MKQVKKSILLCCLLLFSFVTFFIKGITTLDADFGWHLTLGRLILQKGIPKTDPFSYSMPSFPFIDHEWLTNIIIAKLYGFGGMFLLAGIFACIGALTFLVIYLVTNRSSRAYSFIPCALAIAMCIAVAGIRPQVITWFFLACLLWLLQSRWYFLFIPILFLLWVNMHAGFALGIVLVGIFTLSQIITKRKISPKLCLFFVVCILVTFINPYGPKIWIEVYRQISDSSLRFRITEWEPAVFFPEYISLWVFFGISVVLFFIYRKHFSLFEKISYCFLLISGLSSIRNIPLWMIVAIPLYAKSFSLLAVQAAVHTGGKKRFLYFHSFFAGISIVIVIWQTISLLWGASITHAESIYPKKEVQFLQTHEASGNLFSVYDWGGYLIWKLPEKKVFIDGRMPSWRWQAPNNKESSNAFLDYENILTTKSGMQKAIVKYNITTILIPQEKPPRKDKKNSLDYFYTMLLVRMHIKSNYIFLPDELKQMGFKKIYQGNVGEVYRKM